MSNESGGWSTQVTDASGRPVAGHELNSDDRSADSSSRNNVWALDIETSIGHPHYGYPIQAHLIVSDDGIRRTTACGKVLTAANHPTGWWSMAPGRLPLAPHAIHCGEAGTAP